MNIKSKRSTSLLALLLICSLAAKSQTMYEESTLNALLKMNKGKALDAKLQELSNDKAKGIYTAIAYFNRVEDYKRSDSLQRIVGKEYPYSASRSRAYINELDDAENLSDLQNRVDNYLKHYDRRFVDDVYLNAAIRAGQTPEGMVKAIDYVDNIKQDYKKFMGMSNNALYLDYHKSDLAGEYTKAAIALEEQLFPRLEKVRSYEQSITNLNLLYARQLIASGQSKEALKWTKGTYALNKFKDHELDFYVDLLNSEKDYNELFTVMDLLAKQGKLTSKYQTLMATSYRETRGSNFEQYLSAINEQLKAAAKKAIVQHAVEKPVPDFEVLDTAGRAVHIRDFRGKTVILDFWATWCAPCKASLPAMQEAVNHYKNDKDVIFMFIHTFSRKPGSSKKEAVDYLEANHFNLDLYLDNRQANGSSKAAEAFHVKGIPIKFVIDRSGIIRYETSGYSGAHTSTVYELIEMIEEAKKK